ncbi:MAG: ATP-dependent sacrificial sulfur transferase LarE [Coprobacillus sp.]
MDKLETLKEILRKYQRIAIAYSGGCDSNFLFQVAKETLGTDNVFAVLCIGDMMSKEDVQNARELLNGSYYGEIPINVFDVDEFKYNDKRRCYYCKKTIMSKVKELAYKNGFEYVVDGKNLDDEGVYRPGIQACKELGILSPLSESQMTKQDIRFYSKELGIVTHDKPANACLASRFQYNTLLTKEKLQMVNDAEALFHKIGIYYVRVRVQDTLARIEVESKDFDKVVGNKELISSLKKLGFQFITLDLEGITSGSYDR